MRALRLRPSIAACAAMLFVPAAFAKDKADAAAPVPQVHHVIAAGSLALIAQTGALVIEDISDPGRPRRIGKLERPGDVRAVALAGSTAYVATGTRGLVAVDVSQSDAPRTLGIHDTAGSVRDVAVRGSVVAIADDARGLEIVSFADPARPRPLASFPSRDTVQGVSWRGTLLATAEGNGGVRLFDLTHEGAPSRLAAIERPTPALSVALCDDNLLLVAMDVAGLRTFDVSDPARPAPAGSIAGLGHVRSVSCEGKLAAVGCGDRGIVLVDLTARSAPRIVGAVERLDGYPAERVTLAGKLVLVAAGQGGMGVVSIEDPAAPVTLLPRPRKMRINFP